MEDDINGRKHQWKTTQMVSLNQKGNVIGVNLGADDVIEQNYDEDEEADTLFWCKDCESFWQYKNHLMWNQS